MNARQCKKQLKRQIEKLNNKNDLLERVINNDPAMKEMYRLYSQPLNVTTSTLQWIQLRSKRCLPPKRLCYDDVFIGFYKKELERELFDGIKDFISYEIDTESFAPTITASIFVGKK